MYLSDRPVSEMTVKANYAFLLDKSFQPPHCVEKWRPVYGDLYWSDTWSQFLLAKFHRSTADLSWKVAHGVLYTLDRLARFQYSNLKDCYCESAGESLEHLFFSCPLAQSVLGWVSLLFFTAAPNSPTLQPRHLLFGFNGQELASVPKIFPVILILCKWSIWLARNDYRFRDRRPSVEDVIASLKAHVIFSIRRHFRHCTSDSSTFVKQWCANGLLGTIEGERLRLKI